METKVGWMLMSVSGSTRFTRLAWPGLQCHLGAVGADLMRLASAPWSAGVPGHPRVSRQAIHCLPTHVWYTFTVVLDDHQMFRFLYVIMTQPSSASRTPPNYSIDIV